MHKQDRVTGTYTISGESRSYNISVAHSWTWGRESATTREKSLESDAVSQISQSVAATCALLHSLKFHSTRT